MTMLNNKDRSIHFSHAENIQENVVDAGMHKLYTYTPELPIITCSSKKDAEIIQQRINTFVRELSHELLKE